MSAPVLNLALASLWNRRSTAMLTMLAIALSVTLMLAVEKLRRDARGAFANTISGTDLIVGARSGALQLMLYSVFRIGNATNNMSWDMLQGSGQQSPSQMGCAHVPRRFAPRLSRARDINSLFSALPLCAATRTYVRER